MDEQTQDPEEKAIENFYFLIFYADPVKDLAYIWIDDGKVHLVIKRDKFYKLIKSIVGLKASYHVEKACQDYGTFFLFDRQKEIIKELSNCTENEKLQISKIHKDIMQAIEDEKEKNKFQPKSLNNKNKSINSQYGFINYSNHLDGIQQYKPY